MQIFFFFLKPSFHKINIWKKKSDSGTTAADRWVSFTGRQIPTPSVFDDSVNTAIVDQQPEYYVIYMVCYWTIHLSITGFNQSTAGEPVVSSHVAVGLYLFCLYLYNCPVSKSAAEGLLSAMWGSCLLFLLQPDGPDGSDLTCWQVVWETTRVSEQRAPRGESVIHADMYSQPPNMTREFSELRQETFLRMSERIIQTKTWFLTMHWIFRTVCRPTVDRLVDI